MTTRQSLPLGTPSPFPRGFCTMAVTRVFSSDSLTRAGLDLDPRSAVPPLRGCAGGFLRNVSARFHRIATAHGGQGGYEVARQTDGVLEGGEGGAQRQSAAAQGVE